VLQELFACYDRASADWRAFETFRERAGPAFERSCLFLALRTHFAKARSSAGDWHEWPKEFRSCNSSAIERFATEQAVAVTFQAWLQFIADSQLRACREAAGEMAVGLYRDLAVGADPGGAETWANPLAVVDTAQVGAPPDIYNPQGQDWGLPPFSPRALRAEGYRSFIDLVRANMRHAGGLRIDHVMALQQLYWVPKGKSPAEGAYVSYPLEDLVGILALESHRNRCLVVGEDLGTVPHGFRERMERGNILSYRVIFFEKDESRYIAPEDYPPLALAVAGNHDLPTLRAWWRGQDLKLKHALNLFPTELEAARAASDRDEDRQALDRALRKTEVVGNSSLDEGSFVEAAHEFLARTPCVLTMLQLDDITGEVDPVNVPTTSSEHANWRRRQSVELEQLSEQPGFISATQALRMHRK
jgi:4-alpha-glucanotransferase